MQKYLLIISLLLIGLYTHAQQNNEVPKGASVQGIIYDSINDIPLQSASVIFYDRKDSTIKGFQVTEYNGGFSVAELPIKTPMYYIVSFTGYNSYIDTISLDAAGTIKNLGTITMEQTISSDLDAVVVKSVVPIRMNGDTLEINPDAFKLDSNAVVEDMLLRVPGMVVWSDGTVTMNGRKIDNLLVDGKPFFGGDTKIATQNLPKNAIEKIQLYQQVDPTKIQGVDNDKQDSLYSMNVQLKEDKKKGMFGKVGAGYGTDKRYDGSGVLQAYDPKNQIGIAIGADNINKSGGIGTDAFIDNTFKQGFLRYRYSDPSTNGIKKNLWGAAKLQHSFNETDNGQYYSRITADYTIKRTDQTSTNQTEQTDNLIDYDQLSNSITEDDNTTTSHQANVKYERRNKYSNFIDINSSFSNDNTHSSSQSSNNVYRDGTALSANQVTNSSRSHKTNLNLDLISASNSWNNTENSLNSYSISGGFNYGKNNSFNHTENNFQSFIDSIPSNNLVRNYNTKSDNYDGNIRLSYNALRQLLFGVYNFYNIDIELNNQISVSKNTQNTRVEDLDSINNNYHVNQDLSNDNTLKTFTYSPGIAFRKTFNKWVPNKFNYWLNIRASLSHRWLNQQNTSSLLYRNIDRKYHLWEPSFNFNYNGEQPDKYRIRSYAYSSYSPTLPSIDQLVPILDTTNRYNVTVGNPNLQIGRTFSNHLSFSIDRANRQAKSGYGVSVDLSYSRDHNGIIDSLVYDASGKSLRYLLNGDGHQYLSVNTELNFSSKLDKLHQLQAKYRPRYSRTQSPGYINGLSSNSTNTTFSHELSLGFIILEKFNTTINSSISTNKNSQAGAFGVSPTIKNYTSGLDATYYITKKWSISSNFQYQSNKAETNSSTASIWNATSSLRFMQDKAELKFTAFDLLHENKNIVNFVNRNSIGTTISNGLQQYFLLSFSYFPRKFGGSSKNRGGSMIIIR